MNADGTAIRRTDREKACPNNIVQGKAYCGRLGEAGSMFLVGVFSHVTLLWSGKRKEDGKRKVPVHSTAREGLKLADLSNEVRFLSLRSCPRASQLAPTVAHFQSAGGFSLGAGGWMEGGSGGPANRPRCLRTFQNLVAPTSWRSDGMNQEAER